MAMSESFDGFNIKGLFWLFLSLWGQAISEIRRTKFTYCIGVTSVFIVVLVSAVVQTLMANTPLIFLRQAESVEGQTDFLVEPSAFTNYFAINYTLAEHTIAESAAANEFAFSTPRYDLAARVFPVSSCPGYESWGVDEDNSWMYVPEPGSTCIGVCATDICDADNTALSGSMYLIDSTREARMGLGRQWQHGRIPPGQVMLSSKLAQNMGVDVGDVVLLELFVPYMIRHAFAPHETGSNDWQERSFEHSQVVLPVTVYKLFGDSGGKFPSSVDDGILLEYDSFVEYAASRLHPAIRFEEEPTDSTPRARNDGNLYDFAPKVYWNINPSARLDVYIDSNYDTVKEHVISFSSRLLFVLGFTQLNAEAPLLSFLNFRQFVSLYLGLLLSILLFILSALSAILVYSLMMINVQGRTFELAVRRTLGSSRIVLVFMLAFQALTYSIPAWIFGLLAARGITHAVLSSFGESAGIPFDPNLTGTAVLTATALAFGTPLIASIGPIRTAMSTSLRDALDVDRPKTSALKYSIERAEDKGMSWTVVVVGCSLFIFGFCIYYLLPLSLLSLNLALFINIFFWILIGMLFGFVLLALNIEVPLERVLAKLFLFWDRAVVVRVAVSNLIAHKERNRKTMVMYALSISFIVFITVAANQEVQSSTFETRRLQGAPLTVEGPEEFSDPTTVSRLEAAVRDPSVAQYIKGTAWISREMEDTVPNSDTSLRNLGQLFQWSLDFQAASPNIFQTMYEEYIMYGDRSDSDLPLVEQLYTIQGSQGLVLSTTMKIELGISRGNDLVVKVDHPAEGTTLERHDRIRMRAHAFMDKSSWFYFDKYPSPARDVIASWPSFTRVAQYLGVNIGAGDVKIREFMVDLHNPDSDGNLDAVKAKLVEAIQTSPGWSLHDIRDEVEDLDSTLFVLNVFFGVLTAVAMFLCFFSLSVSMVANIQEQKKEIGVLLAVGLDSTSLIRVYIYEAFLLVLASSLMGVIIGTIVAWTFSLQRILFTQLPVAFLFPTGTLITVVLVSIICALLAAAGPARRLTKQPITKLLRSAF